MANDAITRSVVLRTAYELFRKAVEDLNLSELWQRFAVLESHVAGWRREAESVPVLRQANAVLEEKVAKLERRAEDAERERLGVVESQQADVKKATDDSDKRRWQFVFIFAGAIATLIATTVVQLVLNLVKK